MAATYHTYTIIITINIIIWFLTCYVWVSWNDDITGKIDI